MTMIKFPQAITSPASESDELLIAQSIGPVTNTAVEARRVPWPLFCQKMSQPKIGPKNGSYLLRGGELKANQRSNENLLSAHLLVIDGDSHLHAVNGTVCSGAPDFELAKQALDLLPYRYFLHTTHSHRPGLITKWRLFIPAKLENNEQLCIAVDYIIGLLHEKGCMVAPVKENYAWAQPWFIPRVENRELLSGFQHAARLEGDDIDLDIAAAKRKEFRNSEQKAKIPVINASVSNPSAHSYVIDSGYHGSDKITHLRRAIPCISAVLQKYGYKYFPSTDRWLHPNSKSGTPGIVVVQGNDGVERIISHHTSDPLYYGTEVFGVTAHDVIDIEIVHRYGTSDADWKAGFRALCDEYGIIETNSDERRQQQKNENKAIGDGAPSQLNPDIINLPTALERFVFIGEGSRVADLNHPKLDFSLNDFGNYFAASKAVGNDDKKYPVTALWLGNKSRKTVATKTFRPGADEITTNPNGLPALNTWRPFKRTPGDSALAAPFIEHITWLFGQEAEHFLDFLAHIEQQPGTLPHTAWLHIAEKTGLGRNWIAAVLARVWTGYVAASLDVVRILEGAFNGELSGKLLAQVDEIREGGGTNGWRISERFKSVINETTRTINPKYGRISQEFNACRWLLFSNHRSAIRISEGDRRFNISICEAEPKDPLYYIRLYELLKKPEFIAGVAAYLGERDIRNFNPGGRAKASQGRAAVIAESRSEAQDLALLVVQSWPCDLILSRDLGSIIAGENQPITPAHRHSIEDAGLRPYGKPVKLRGKPERLYIVRNASKWSNADSAAIAAEFNAHYPIRHDGGATTWREWIELKSIENQ